MFCCTVSDMSLAVSPSIEASNHSLLRVPSHMTSASTLETRFLWMVVRLPFAASLFHEEAVHGFCFP